MVQITLGNALAQLCNPRIVSTIEYRKTSAGDVGVYGRKEGVTLHVQGGSNHFLNVTKKLGADGQIKLYQPAIGHVFDLVIDCITHIDGQEIDHPFR